MKQIEWRGGKYKYREATFAYVNNIQVAVITKMHDNSKFDAKVLLPGLPKGTNSFSSVDSAKENLEKRINQWFELVAQ